MSISTKAWAAGSALLLLSLPGGVSSAPDPGASAEGAVAAPRCGTGTECTRLALRYAKGDGVPQSWPVAHLLLERACALGDGVGCEALASCYQYAYGVPEDMGRAIPLLDRACELGNGRGCAILGGCYATASGVQKDERRAAELFARGCALGAAIGCRWQADGLVRGGSKAALEQSRALYQKSCDLGDGGGCWALAAEHRSDRTAAGAARRLDLVERACTLRWPDACFEMGDRFEQGLGRPRDSARAREALQSACQDGHAVACDRLAALHVGGGGGERDAGKAAALRDRACALGHAPTCGR